MADTRTDSHPLVPEAAVLTREARGFVDGLVRTFGGRIEELLEARRALQARLDRGERFDFLPETRAVREGSWRVSSLPKDLQDRRVEITGPVDRKMIVNALNSGANVFMADFEDSNAPTWSNLIRGQKNLMDAIRREIDFVDPTTHKAYALVEKPAVLLVRPRGLHLPEDHYPVDGKPAPASLFDFGLHVFHNAKAHVERGTGPYYYLPKLESHHEARLWNDVFEVAEKALGLPIGTIRATVLIETLPAAFQMHEILHALGEHAAGLNCGRWDYIFSFIKKLRGDATAVLPDRAEVTMQQHFLRSYTELLVQTCHARGVHAMGGMAAQIPIKGDAEKNAAALEKVRADKLREVKAGHDGTWVAHPALVPIAREVFDAHMPGPNQLGNARLDVKVTAADLLRVPEGHRTEEGLRHNVRVAVQYLAAWLAGNGCVPLYGLMEDAATAEISRAQIWQWVRHGARLETPGGGTVVATAELVHRVIAEEVAALPEKTPEIERASRLFASIATADSFPEFLTLPAYRALIGGESSPPTT